VGDDATRLSGRRKVAALLIALGADRAAPILRQLSEAEIEEVTREIVRIERLPAALREEILAEAYQDVATRQFAQSGGTEYARELLGRALPSQKASEMLARAGGGRRDRPFSFVADLDPSQVAQVLETEHPQTIALVLSHLQPDVSGRILVALEPELRAEVTTRLAVMSRTNPERVREVEQVLRRRLAVLELGGLRRAGGLDHVVGILSTLDSRSERAILEALADRDPELAEAVRKQMFVFEDIRLLDDRSIRRLLQDVRRELSLALRTASAELRQRIFDNMSSRSRQELQQEMAIRGPARVRDIEDAQQRIVETTRKLAEQEEIHISRGREDVFI
jgi:flagellar motor switch protein FliG